VTPPLNDQQRQQIEAELFAGRKISAIKLYRDATGTGLAEAKHAVEDIEVDLRRQNPERFISQPRAGCLGLVMLVALILAAAAFLVFHLRRT
jgi:hypothetical protein